MTCTDFYEKIKKDQRLLQKVHSSEKYEWYDKDNVNLQ